MKTTGEYIAEELEFERQLRMQGMAGQARNPEYANYANLVMGQGTTVSEAIHLRAKVRQLTDQLATETERCAKIAEEVASEIRHAIKEQCFNAADNAIEKIAAKIRGAQ